MRITSFAAAVLATCAAFADLPSAWPDRYLSLNSRSGWWVSLAAKRPTSSWRAPSRKRFHHPGACNRWWWFNIARAGGNIGAEAVAHAAPRWLHAGARHRGHALNIALYSKMPYDMVKDFAPVILVASTPNVLVVHNPSVPAKNGPGPGQR
ncbi:hypothetical protein ACU4GD_26930 [Cupriavidus basilensis]